MNNIHKGFYAAFEGMDGVGKTTIMEAVSTEVEKRLSATNLGSNIIRTHHPGSTPLGKHIRKLVKDPASIDPDIYIDDLSRQCLYIVDMISFVRTILDPALEYNRIVVGDRHSAISSMVYGMADGLDLKDIERMSALVKQPRVDRLYVLTCPIDVVNERLKKSRGSTADHYDKKADDFRERLSGLYSDLVTGSPEYVAAVSRLVDIEDVLYFDTTLPMAHIVDAIASDFVRTYIERCIWASA